MRITQLALAFGIALTLTGGVASAQQQFNGSWTIEVTTESGSCVRAYRFPVVIENGQVRYGGPERVNVSGAVTSTGDIRSTPARLARACRSPLAGPSRDRGRWPGTGPGSTRSPAP